jgi:predicted O-methyltransferase YrrM
MNKWYQPSSRKDLKPIPWLAPDVIERLESLIQPDWEILEHGSGGSTLWFAERAKSVTAFEDDPDWQMIVRSKAPENVTVYSAVDGVSLTFNNFDLCLIDGEPVRHRVRWIEDAVQLVKPGGWVVLDNANRPEYAEERKALHALAVEVQTYTNNDPHTLYLVTDFCRMPEAELEAKPKRRSKKASK